MKFNEISSDIKIIEKHITDLENNKKKDIEEKKKKIVQLTNKYTDNISEIDQILTIVEHKEKEIEKIKTLKKNKINTLLSNISEIQNAITHLKNKNEDLTLSQISLLIKEIEKNKKSIISTKKSISYYTKKIAFFQRREQQKRENENMMEEELFSCKKLLIILTSKIESLSEFIKNILKTKNTLSNSLEKLNEINPANTNLANEITEIEIDKLADDIYSYCNDYLVFSVEKEEFLHTACSLNDFEELIEYLNKISKYKLTQNLFEYLIIALCRMNSYEKVLDIRMRFVNSITEPNSYIPTLQNNKKEKSQNEIKELIKTKKMLILTLENQQKLNEEKLKEITKKKEENENIIHDMENDLYAMINYKDKIYNDVVGFEKELCQCEKSSVNRIELLKKENIELEKKIKKKKEKLIEREEQYQNEINSIYSLKSKLFLQKDELIKKSSLYTGTRTTTNNTRAETTVPSTYTPEFIFPPSMNEKDLMLTQKLSPLLSGVMILKRSLINIKKQIYDNYTPVIRNKFVDPLDFGFKKFFLYLDRGGSKIFFQKLTPLDKTIDISTNSISKIEVPIVTKNLIFLKRLLNYLIKNKKVSSLEEIEEYIQNHKDEIMKFYNGDDLSSSNLNPNASLFDMKILNRDYREALIENKKYILYLYLKPDNDTKIEIIFETSTEYKYWVNGLTEILKHPEKIKKIIESYLI